MSYHSKFGHTHVISYSLEECRWSVVTSDSGFVNWKHEDVPAPTTGYEEYGGKKDLAICKHHESLLVYCSDEVNNAQRAKWQIPSVYNVSFYFYYYIRIKKIFRDFPRTLKNR